MFGVFTSIWVVFGRVNNLPVRGYSPFESGFFRDFKSLEEPFPINKPAIFGLEMWNDPLKAFSSGGVSLGGSKPTPILKYGMTGRLGIDLSKKELHSICYVDLWDKFLLCYHPRYLEDYKGKLCFLCWTDFVFPHGHLPSGHGGSTPFPR